MSLVSVISFLSPASVAQGDASAHANVMFEFSCQANFGRDAEFTHVSVSRAGGTKFGVCDVSPCQKSVWLLGNVNTPAVSNNIMLLVSVMQYHKSNNVRYKNAGQTRYESVFSWEDQLFIQRQRQNAAVLLSLLERQQEVGLQRLPALKDNKRACGWNR